VPFAGSQRRQTGDDIVDQIQRAEQLGRPLGGRFDAFQAKELGDRVQHPLGDLGDLRHLLKLRAARIQLGQHHLGVAQDNHQRVAQVMRGHPDHLALEAVQVFERGDVVEDDHVPGLGRIAVLPA